METVAKKTCSVVASAVRRIAVEGTSVSSEGCKDLVLRRLLTTNDRVISEPLTRWQNVPSNEEVGQSGC